MQNVTGTVTWSRAYHDYNLLTSEALRKREELWKNSPHSFICRDGEYQCKEGELVKIGEFELPEEQLYLLPKSTTVTNKNMDALQEFTDISFAPLIDFLKREYPGQIVEKILDVMMFIGVESLDEGDYFVYENTATGKTIALTRTGRVAHHVDGALDYDGSAGERKRDEFY